MRIGKVCMHDAPLKRVMRHTREPLIYSRMNDGQCNDLKCTALNAVNIENIFYFSSATVEVVRLASAVDEINRNFSSYKRSFPVDPYRW